MSSSALLLIPGQPIPTTHHLQSSKSLKAGKGTYLDAQGQLRASIVGRVSLDDDGLVSVVAAAAGGGKGQVGGGGGEAGVVPEIGNVVVGTVSTPFGTGRQLFLPRQIGKMQFSQLATFTIPPARVMLTSTFSYSFLSPSSVLSLVFRFCAPLVRQVIRLTPQQATIQILLVNNLPVASLPPSTSGGGGSGSNDGYTGLVRAQDVRLASIEPNGAPFKMSESFRLGDLVRAEVLSLGDARSYYLTTAARNELGVISARNERTGEEMVAVSWREMKDPTTGEVERRKVAKPE